MSTLSSLTPSAVPIRQDAHQWARLFAVKQPNQAIAKQVYLNTLAVYTVHSYLESQGIETDLESSDSWSPGWLSPPDVADLVVTNVGRLECRPVIEDATEFRLPESAWNDRVAYVAVRFRESLQAAELVGYLPVPEGEPPSTIAMSQLLPIADLLRYVQCLGKAITLLESDDEVMAKVSERLESQDRTEILRQLYISYFRTEEGRLSQVLRLERLLQGDSQLVSRDAGLAAARDPLPLSGSAAAGDEEITAARAEPDLEALAEQLLEKLEEIWGDRGQ